MTRAMAVLGLTGLMAAAPPLSAVAAECPKTGTDRLRIDGGTVTAIISPHPATAKVGREFALDIILCGAAGHGAIRRIDASMPVHRHGMNYRPGLTQTAPGRYRVKGMMFHMPGLWRIDIATESGGKRERLRSEVSISP